MLRYNPNPDYGKYKHREKDILRSRRNPDSDDRSIERRALGGDTDAVRQHITQCRRTGQQPSHPFSVTYMETILNELDPQQEMTFDMLLALVQEARALNVVLYLASRFYRDMDADELQDDWFLLPEHAEELAQKHRLTWL